MMGQPASGEKKLDKASPQLMQVKVLEVNEKAKTFSTMLNGKVVSFQIPNLKSLPKRGDTIDIQGNPSLLPTPCGGYWICRGYPIIFSDCICPVNL